MLNCSLYTLEAIVVRRHVTVARQYGARVNFLRIVARMHDVVVINNVVAVLDAFFFLNNRHHNFSAMLNESPDHMYILSPKENILKMCLQPKKILLKVDFGWWLVISYIPMRENESAVFS